ncbi:hypothetical protein TGME49_250000 [Toxoplasma gondii ME49]|uniref:Uncharacterized protein n=3 Tax=Toxoplasma gondii TaxID=5811 RepID=B6KHK9_TOXGV|nr:hypothetical protein TGME49_250000 [Toxoplasma gondii ME49]EPT25156.1 hypothetical protein TGME49_250000 [Toxoplasma gondii ME49]ESS34458.1 hypothetical protein TGVEG_250000 [Toxoplasma gondii VEG]KYF50156.1 hypothetical protein TGARI_250000 [Toxoplasma gondii ARI]CEL78611.1 TPA: hypothetical protein BN1205_001840 [Toxoplasma gondii VEG]|eukprot:XP_002367332.1 hypothetical protein TGME49_250000 [Toxoplasma gondii ME49]
MLDVLYSLTTTIGNVGRQKGDGTSFNPAKRDCKYPSGTVWSGSKKSHLTGSLFDSSFTPVSNGTVRKMNQTTTEITVPGYSVKRGSWARRIKDLLVPRYKSRELDYGLSLSESLIVPTSSPSLSNISVTLKEEQSRIFACFLYYEFDSSYRS